MSAKIVFFLGFVALAQAGFLAAPTAYYAQAPTLVKTLQPAILKKVVAAEEPANYQFNYDVADGSTGDVHSQSERADNGVIHGSYQLNDADGFLRTVEYTADDVNGFQANVRREPLGHQHQLVKKIVAQPIVAKYVQARAGWQ